LLSSRAMHGGVKVKIVGPTDDHIAHSLRNFLALIGHLYLEDPQAIAAAVLSAQQELSQTHKKGLSGMLGKVVNRVETVVKKAESGLEKHLKHGDGKTKPLSEELATENAVEKREEAEAEIVLSHELPPITVYVMTTIAERDALFGSDTFPFNHHTSLFIWSPSKPDSTRSRTMRLASA